MKNILLKLGDIITMDHVDDDNNTQNHPFLIVHISNDNKYFLALQITSAKFNENGEIISLNNFTNKIYEKRNYVIVDENNGFKYISLVLLEYVYKIFFGKNKYNIKKISEFVDYNYVTLGNIIEESKRINIYTDISKYF